MDITRHNYEEYFILYVDNELNAAERKAVETFVQENPDLEEELIMLQQSILRPDNNVMFTRKENLLKDTASQGLVNEGNYEEYFVLYGDDELTNAEKDLVEQFVYKYPQYQVEFELIQQARLVPESMSFPDKTYLYRTEEDDNKVVPFAWWRIAAAAVVLLVVGSIGWFMSTQDQPGQQGDVTMAETKTNNSPKNTVHPTVENRPAVTKTTTEDQKEELTNNAEPAEATSHFVKNTTAVEKKFREKSNISIPADVQPKTEPLQPVQEPIINEVQLAVKPVNEAVSSYTASVVNSPVAKQTISEPVAATAIAATTADEMNDGKTYVLNTSVNKTPLRGFLRKVSRVVNKATSFEVSENDKGGVRIANFELALK